MAMMDEVAFMAATRFSRQVMLTVSSNRIDFKKSIPSEITPKTIKMYKTLQSHD